MSDYSPFAHGSADHPHDTSTNDPWNLSYLPSDLVEPMQRAGGTKNPTMPMEFMTLIQMALAQSGVNANSLSISQVYKLAQLAWQDSTIQQDFAVHAGIASYASVTDYTVTSGGVITDIVNQMFSPGNSNNPQLLSLGLSMLQQQGKPLSSEQTKFLGNAQSTVPRPFQGNFPISYDFEQGDPGIDYAMPVGTQISTPFSGTVVLDQSGKGNWGNRVMIKLDNGWTFGVGHLTAFGVQQGQRVNPGDILGYSGGDPSDPNSGITTGPHIEVQWINPQGQMTNPHAIIDPIMAGTTFGQIGESGAIGQGVNTPKFPGQDPLLEAQFPGVVSVWQKYYGQPPTGRQIQGLVGSMGAASGRAVAAGAATVSQLAMQVGFTADEAKIVAAISIPESGGNPSRDQFPGQNYGGIGLMQIEFEAHPDLVAKYGGVQGLHDPLNNLRAAYDVFVSAGRSFSPWTTYTGGQYLRYMGRDPSVTTGGGAVSGTGLDMQQIEDSVRGLPSHLPGLNNGQYFDLRGLADGVSQQYLGHAATDGIVAELFATKQTGKSDVDLWYKTHSPSDLNSAQYQKVYQANQPYLQNIYNEQGFDPRWAAQQYTQPPAQAPSPPPAPPPEPQTPAGSPLPGKGRGSF